MQPTHIAVSVACLLSGLSALAGYLLPSPGLLGAGVYFGYWATLGAMLISVFLVGVLIDRARVGAGRLFIRRSWLGLVNGAVALVFWVWVIGYDS